MRFAPDYHLLSKPRKTEVERLHCKAAVIKKPAFDFMKSISTGHGNLSIMRCLYLPCALLLSIIDPGKSKEEVVRTARQKFPGELQPATSDHQRGLPG